MLTMTNLSSHTEDKAAGAAGSTDKKGDDSETDLFFSSSIRLSASSHVSRTSGAGSNAKLFFSSAMLLSKPIAPRASAAYRYHQSNTILQLLYVAGKKKKSRLKL